MFRIFVIVSLQCGYVVLLTLALVLSGTGFCVAGTSIILVLVIAQMVLAGVLLVAVFLLVPVAILLVLAAFLLVLVASRVALVTVLLVLTAYQSGTV